MEHLWGMKSTDEIISSSHVESSCRLYHRGDTDCHVDIIHPHLLAWEKSGRFAKDFGSKLITPCHGNPKPWKMKVLHPNIWVIAPKNEGCGFPWWKVNMEPKVMELWFRWFVFFQFGDFGDFSSPSFSRENNPSCRLAKTNLQGRKGILVSFEEIDSCTGINVAGFYIVGTHNSSRIFRGFFCSHKYWRFKTPHKIHGCLGPRVFFAVFLPSKTHGSFATCDVNQLTTFGSQLKAVLLLMVQKSGVKTSLRW